MGKRKQPKKKFEINVKVNDEIVGYNQVRIVGEGIESKVISLDEASKYAESIERDMVLINENTNPPIVRLCDFEKYVYEQKKTAKKQSTTNNTLKEIQLSVSIASNDLQTKVKKAREFIEKGDKVRVVLTMRGREMVRREENKKSIFEFIQAMSDISVPEAMPKDERNKCSVILKKKK